MNGGKPENLEKIGSFELVTAVFLSGCTKRKSKEKKIVAKPEIS